MLPSALRAAAALASAFACSASAPLPPLDAVVSLYSTLLVAPQCPAGTAPGAFGPALPGFLAAGDDLLPPGAFSLADAKARCAATTGCAGITFHANSSDPQGVIPTVYFKSAFEESDAAGWWSFPLCAPRTLRAHLLHLQRLPQPWPPLRTVQAGSPLHCPCPCPPTAGCGGWSSESW